MVVYAGLFLICYFFIFSSLCSFQTFKESTVRAIRIIDNKSIGILREYNLGKFSSFVALYDKIIHKKPLLDAPAFRLSFSIIQNPLSAIAFSFIYNKLEEKHNRLKEEHKRTR